MKKRVLDCQELPIGATRLARLYVDGREWELDIRAVHPDRFEDVGLDLRSLFHQELEVARRRIRGGTNPDNWRLALHMSEIRGALERLRRIGALVEAPKEA